MDQMNKFDVVSVAYKSRFVFRTDAEYRIALGTSFETVMSKRESERNMEVYYGVLAREAAKALDNSLEDIIAGISLYRPGPMDQIPRYIKNKNNPSEITYKHPMLEDILNVTYGCIIYQEQVLQIVQKLAGYSLGKADLRRRAMSKKKHDVMAREREYFIYGQRMRMEM